MTKTIRRKLEEKITSKDGKEGSEESIHTDVATVALRQNQDGVISVASEDRTRELMKLQLPMKFLTMFPVV